MIKSMKFGPALGLIAILALGACASTSPAPSPAPQPSYPSSSQTSNTQAYPGYGTVQSIDTVKQDYKGIAGTGFGLGTVAGAVIGGVAGRQVGSGRGNTAATAAGAAGGAYIGHQIEKNRSQAPDVYAITVRMDGGSYQTQTITQATTGGLRVGDRVRIENGYLQRY